LERAARQTSRRDAEAQSAAWYTHTGVETLLEIIQLTWLTAFPDAIGFLRQQTAAYPPAGEDPDLEGYDEFRAKKRSTAKRKTEGENSDDDWEEERSWKKHQVHRRVPEEEIDVNADVPIHDRLASRISVPMVGSSETGWPVGYRMESSPLSDVEQPRSISKGIYGIAGEWAYWHENTS
jgi:hypothetical protein